MKRYTLVQIKISDAKTEKRRYKKVWHPQARKRKGLVQTIMQRSIGMKHSNKEKASEKLLRRLLATTFVLLFTLSLAALPTAAKAPETLCPGGIPFGIRFMTDGIYVVGFSDVNENGASYSPAKEAGIRENDCIVKCNEQEVKSAEEFTSFVEGSDGKPITLCVKRGKEALTITIMPRKSDLDQKYKSGMWIRDSGAGIGTVTFVDPESYLFGGLGHGICNNGNGDLVSMTRGTIFDVNVSDVIKGKQGAPGEIKGYFTPKKIGTLLDNTDLGMFGAVTEMPDKMQNDPHCKPIPIGKRNEITEGKATIYSTLDENGITEYEIELTDIRRDTVGGKCFTVKITDERLLKKSGGIIQGMSGSPIIQNGKLVGAVTHVLINDPTTGYGIFIENMLNAANIPMAKAS